MIEEKVDQLIKIWNKKLTVSCVFSVSLQLLVLFLALVWKESLSLNYLNLNHDLSDITGIVTHSI